MAALILVNIGIRAVSLAIRLSPSPPPRRLRAGRRLRHLLRHGGRGLSIFGSIVAATLGCTAGSVDLTAARSATCGHRSFPACPRPSPHPGRSGHHRAPNCRRLLHRVHCVRPRGPDTAQLPERPTYRSACPKPAFETWAARHAQEVICNFNFNIGPNSDLRPGGEQRPVRRPATARVSRSAPGAPPPPRRSPMPQVQSAAPARSPPRTTPITRAGSCPHRSR